MRYLLDTHVLVRWFEKKPSLSRGQQRVLRHIDPEQPIYVSDISLWEVATLYEMGRIRFQMPLREWLDHATAPPLVERIGVPPAVAAEIAVLPRDLHRDPADRILIATARVLGATLVTNDERIVKASLVPTLE